MKTKTKHFSMTFMKTEDFWKVLMEKGIRSKLDEHANLREFLQLNSENPDLILLKNIRRTLDQMSQNEAFMAAIQEDVLSNEEREREEEALARIDRGESLSSDYRVNEIGNEESKLETVKEGNET